jgi:hypothetical protein
MPRAALQARLSFAQETVKECMNVCPDIPRIVDALVTGGLEAMQAACAMQVGSSI